MSIAQYTTPTVTLQFSDETLDLRNAANVYLTIRTKNGEEITKTGTELAVGEKTISAHLSQAETARLKSGECEIHANWTTAAGERAASEIETLNVSKNLLAREVE